MSGVINGGPTAPEDKTAIRDLFLADLERFEASIWKNEEIGEKRFEFFITLVTAVTAGLVALWTSERVIQPKDLPRLTAVALLTLLVFGIVSFWRMVHRDRVTSEYKRTTYEIRQRYRTAFPELTDYKLELEVKAERHKYDSDWTKRRRRIRQMGYTQTLAVVNGLLLMGAGWNAEFRTSLWVASGIVLTCALSVYGANPHDSEPAQQAAKG